MRKQILAAAVVAACAGTSTVALADESTTVGGKSYIDFTSKTAKDATGAKKDDSGLGFDVKRFYVGINHIFDDMYSANVTTDFTYDSSVGKTQVFVKKAYLQSKFSDAAVLRLGSADMPWIPYVEGLYGYRYLENTLIDRLKFGNSADWGAHLGGKLSDGMVNYALSAVNGNGYGNPTRSKSLDFEGRVGVKPAKGLDLAVGFYKGKRGKDTYTAVASSTPINSASRTNFVAAYSYDIVKVGVEYFSAKNWAVTSTDKATGYSVWGAVKPSDTMVIFARYDTDKPNKDTASDKKGTYYNVGVSFQARKNIDLAVAYKNNKDHSSTGDAKTSEIGVWSQVKF